MDHRILIQQFASYFGAGTLKFPVDTEDEILSQASDFRVFSETTNHHGLYLGCPLSCLKRELTQNTLFWCPNGWPAGKYHALASSRLGNRLFAELRIGAAIRNFLLLLESDEIVISGNQTTMDLPLQCGSRLFGVPLLRLVPMPESPDSKWIENSMNSSTMKSTATIYFQGPENVDDLLFALADQLRIVYTRPKGTVARLVEKYSGFPDQSNRGPVMMALVDEPNKPRSSINRLREFGCIDWYLCTDSERNGEVKTIDAKPIPVDIASFQTNEYLSHWTRSERRPWPDQSELNQYDRLFLRTEHTNGPLETLSRILVQQKLLGHGRLIRGGHRVVCFTEVPAEEFPDRRVFRPQHSRWDFELFGISIRRSAIKRLGGKPVTYVDPGSTVPQDPMRSTAGSTDSHVDWSVEREWRVIGDVDLRHIGPSEAFVFVGDVESTELQAN